MFQIQLIAVGGVKEPYWEAACREYARRLTGRCRLQTAELSPCRLPNGPSPAEIAAGLREEAGRILPRLEKAGAVVALCVEGRRMTSEQLAAQFSDWMLNGESRAAFVIGSSYGLDDRVKRRASLRLSMSDMTFPHGLARVMLLEQIYRAFEINAGARYHK